PEPLSSPELKLKTIVVIVLYEIIVDQCKHVWLKNYMKKRAFPSDLSEYQINIVSKVKEHQNALIYRIYIGPDQEKGITLRVCPVFWLGVSTVTPQEILSYCRSDVDILRRCCLEFRELFRHVTDIDPFEKSPLRQRVISYLDRISFKKTPLPSFLHTHARNAGENRVGRYLLDGHHDETNTAYEVHGCFWHDCLNCYARDTVNPVTIEDSTWSKCGNVKSNENWNAMKREEMKRYNINLTDRLEPRDAFFGSRTNAAKLFHECEEDEKIR
ncbi:DNA polymerase, partial [Paramuricea clavata]